jgi:hypothetical protein
MLFGLSVFSSKGYHLVHEIFFVLFIGSAYVYMCLSAYLFSGNYGNLGPDDIKIKSYQAKNRTLKRSTVAILSLVLLYWYHNASCQPYVYSLFCVIQYIFVLLVIHFHWCAYYDFKVLSVNVIDEKVDASCCEKFIAPI